VRCCHTCKGCNRLAAACRREATECLSLLVQLLLGQKIPPSGGGDKAAAAVAPGDVDATMAALLSSDALPLMLQHLGKLPFETRKDVVDVFLFTTKYSNNPGSHPGLEYLRTRAHLVRNLVRGYEDPAVALNCGAMVRSAVSREAAIAASVLNSECLDLFFQYVQARGATYAT
jgi:Mo25-like